MTRHHSSELRPTPASRGTQSRTEAPNTLAPAPPAPDVDSRPDECHAGSTVRVQVPATSANLGPGFDALGLALDLHEEVRLRRLPPRETQPRIAVRGLAAGRLPPGEKLLAYRAAVAVYVRLGRAVPPLGLELETRIPRSGGLGGSAAAIVGGAVAANTLEKNPLTQQEILEVAAGVEGHPDNVAAALLGGLVISVRGSRGLVAKRLDPPRELAAVLCIPAQSISTTTARGVVPQRVGRDDAVFNLSRTALLVAAFQTADWSLLEEAMDDRLHQPARGQAFPALYPTIQAALRAGAHGAALSGAGSAIIALATTAHAEIALAMQGAAQAHGYPSQTAVLQLCPTGAVVTGAVVTGAVVSTLD